MTPPPFSKDHFPKQKYSLLVFLHFPLQHSCIFYAAAVAGKILKPSGGGFFFFFPVEYGLFE